MLDVFCWTLGPFFTFLHLPCPLTWQTVLSVLLLGPAHYGCFGKYTFIGTQPHSFMYVFPVAFLILRCQGWIVVTRDCLTPKLKILPLWLFTKKFCWLLLCVYRLPCPLVSNGFGQQGFLAGEPKKEESNVRVFSSQPPSVLSVALSWWITHRFEDHSASRPALFMELSPLGSREPPSPLPFRPKRETCPSAVPGWGLVCASLHLCK